MIIIDIDIIVVYISIPISQIGDSRYSCVGFRHFNLTPNRHLMMRFHKSSKLRRPTSRDAIEERNFALSLTRWLARSLAPSAKVERVAGVEAFWSGVAASFFSAAVVIVVVVVVVVFVVVVCCAIARCSAVTSTQRLASTFALGKIAFPVSPELSQV